MEKSGLNSRSVKIMENKMRYIMATTFTFLGACSTSFDSSRCNFIGTCRGSDDAFYCNDDLFYIVDEEDRSVVFVGETNEEIRNFCCPDDICDVFNE